MSHHAESARPIKDAVARGIEHAQREGVTLGTLAERCKVSPTSLKNMRSGRPVRHDTAEALEKVLRSLGFTEPICENPRPPGNLPPLAWLRQFRNAHPDGRVGVEPRVGIDGALVLEVASAGREMSVLLTDESDGDASTSEHDPRWKPIAWVKDDWMREIANVERAIGLKRGDSDGFDSSGQLVDRWKNCPLALIPASGDNPNHEISCLPIRYSRGRAFLSLVESSAAGRAPESLWPTIAAGCDYKRTRPPHPGLLGAHVALIVPGEPVPHILLGQRTDAQRTNVGFAHGLWSASFEEGVEPKDRTIIDAFRRGLREELLGDDADGAIIRTMAIVVEQALMNLSVVGLAETRLGFFDVVERWNDREEHRGEHLQLVAMPLEDATVRACIEAREIAPEARRRCVPASRVTWEQTNTWRLHPTSAVRLALALWAVNQRKPR